MLPVRSYCGVKFAGFYDEAIDQQKTDKLMNMSINSGADPGSTFKSTFVSVHRARHAHACC